MDTPKIIISDEILKLIATIDEFKGAWRAFQNLAPESLNRLRKVATVESIASSTAFLNSGFVYKSAKLFAEIF